MKELIDAAEESPGASTAFYRLLDEILTLEVTRSQAAITAKAMAEKCTRTSAEEKRIAKRIEEYQQAKISLPKLKQSILNIANKHAVDEVLTSYYCMM